MLLHLRLEDLGDDILFRPLLFGIIKKRQYRCRILLRSVLAARPEQRSTNEHENRYSDTISSIRHIAFASSWTKSLAVFMHNRGFSTNVWPFRNECSAIVQPPKQFPQQGL